MYKIVCCFMLIFSGLIAFAQNDDLSSMLDDSASANPVRKKVSYTFKTSRLINLTTNEQVKRGELDFRIAHRFLDMAGSGGGTKNFFGLDGVADIRFSFDYGMSDRWAIGIGRSKGAYKQSQVFDLNTKLKILQQETNGIPIGLSFHGAMTYTTMPSDGDPSSETNFAKPIHRIQYFGQLIIVKKISPQLSVVIAPTVIQRNLVSLGDANTQFAVGVGARMKINKRAAIIADYYHLLNKSSYQKNVLKYVPPIGIGFELETGGHVFHAIISNTRGLVESQYLTQGAEDPTIGQIRLGFNISRIFTILKNKQTN